MRISSDDSVSHLGDCITNRADDSARLYTVYGYVILMTYTPRFNDQHLGSIVRVRITAIVRPPSPGRPRSFLEERVVRPNGIYAGRVPAVSINKWIYYGARVNGFLHVPAAASLRGWVERIVVKKCGTREMFV